jgi:hypothetical protein
MTDLTSVVLEWVLARRALFSVRSPTTEMFERFNKAEKALMDAGEKTLMVSGEISEGLDALIEKTYKDDVA